MYTYSFLDHRKGFEFGNQTRSKQLDCVAMALVTQKEPYSGLGLIKEGTADSR